MITKFNFKDRTIKSYAIRKLTPFECFRLMGVRDATIHIMQSTVAQAKARVKGWFGKGKDNEQAISSSLCYKQAGNSIVVDTLAAIYSTLIYPQPPKPKAQLSMFDTLFPEDALPAMPPKPYRDGDEFTVLTTFSGYDSQLMACDALREHHPNFRWTCAGWSDIDKYACQMHDLIFPQFADKALGDITKIDWHKVRESLAGREIDLFTYSSPCQDISHAGKQMGLKEGSGTRSALLWNVADAVEILRPKYLLQENVAALVSEKFMPDFQLWIDRLKSLGYVTKWALLNAKDIGMEGTGPVPQNRLRVFAISMRQDCAFDYQFPEPMPLTKRLEDILKPEVEEKYFLKDDAVSKFFKANDKDTALFHQFPLSPTHEDAMFLKTWLQFFMERSGSITTILSGKVETINYRTAWELAPTLLDEALTHHSPTFQRLYDHWKQTGDFPDEFFHARFEENMKPKS